MTETPMAPYVVERRAGAWCVIDTRDGSVWTTLGGTQRAYQRALNLAREHNMELRHTERVRRREVQSVIRKADVSHDQR